MDPINSPIKDVKLAVYDLEWYPGSLVPRLYGFFDGSRYVSFEHIDHFMNHVLSKKYRGYWMFAHFGGLYDFTFFLRYFMSRSEYTLECRFSGSSAVHVTVHRGRDTWFFCDSGFLLRASLEKIGSWIGLAKGGASKEERLDIFTGGLAELIEYNEKDCRILFAAIRLLETVLRDLGGELRATLASCAMRLFRRKYLKETINTSTMINNLVLPAYTASRVEPFGRLAPAGTKKYDINSSFPSSMASGPCPGNFLDITRRLPTSYDPALLIAECSVTIPECYLPPVPYRTKDGRIFFPTGTFRNWFSGEDLALLEETGCAIVTVHRVCHFAPCDALAQYARDLYAKKNQADRDGNKFWRETYKLLSNGLYGKFHEKAVKQGVLLNPDQPGCPHVFKGRKKHPANECVEVLSPGIHLVTDTVKIQHQHTPFAIHITAKSRRLLYNGLRDAWNGGRDRIYYCDTDSVITTGTLPTSDELGAFKLEGVVEQSAEFLAPKLYRFDLEVKAKGFTGLSVEGFEGLKEGRPHTVTHFARPRELLRKKRLDPIETQVAKMIYLDSRGAMSKRATLPDGDSRPWTIDEINAPPKV